MLGVSEAVPVPVPEALPMGMSSLPLAVALLEVEAVPTPQSPPHRIPACTR